MMMFSTGWASNDANLFCHPLCGRGLQLKIVNYVRIHEFPAESANCALCGSNQRISSVDTEHQVQVEI